MPLINEVIAFLKRFAPLDLAEDWDNVGLLLGDANREAKTILTCLTLTPDVAEEAVERSVDLVVTHHPILFRPVQKIVADSPSGSMLLVLVKHNVAVYSPHTGFDSAAEGINAQLAEGLELHDVEPLRKSDADPSRGSGRFGTLPEPETLTAFVERVKQLLHIDLCGYVGDDDLLVSEVGIACGAAAEYLRDADRVGCQVLLTGEARFHACLETISRGMGMVLPGHYASERHALERLAIVLSEQFPTITSSASEVERDPMQFR